MREILFKAKRKDNGEWVEGYYRTDPDLNMHFICGWDYYLSEDGLERESFEYEIDPDTLCQFTGLTDKNGEKIWENDILECGMRLRVSWHHFKASWVLSKKGWMYNHFFGESVEPEDVEVIGNIFDNPELLEVEREK